VKSVTVKIKQTLHIR